MHSLQPSYKTVANPNKLFIIHSPKSEQRLTATLEGDNTATEGLEAGQVLVQDTVTKLCRAYVADEVLAGDDVLYGLLSYAVPAIDRYIVEKDEVTKTAKTVTITVLRGGTVAKDGIVDYSTDIDAVFNGEIIPGSTDTGEHYKFNI